MKKKIFLLLLCCTPLLMFLNVWQVYRYQQLEQEIARREILQEELIEENKRTLAAIASLTSPAQLTRYAENRPDLIEADNQKKLFIHFRSREDDRDSR